MKYFYVTLLVGTFSVTAFADHLSPLGNGYVITGDEGNYKGAITPDYARGAYVTDQNGNTTTSISPDYSGGYYTTEEKQTNQEDLDLLPTNTMTSQEK